MGRAIGSTLQPDQDTAAGLGQETSLLNSGTLPSGAFHEPQKVVQASCLFGADGLEACPTLQPAARFMAPTHVQFLEVLAAHEPGGARLRRALTRCGTCACIWLARPTSSQVDKNLRTAPRTGVLAGWLFC